MPRNYRKVEPPPTSPEGLEAAAAVAARLLTAEEAAVALRLRNAAAVRHMVHVGKLPAIKVGRRLLIARTTIEAMVGALEAIPVRVPKGGGVGAARVALPSAPLLHGAHTLFACFEARGRNLPPAIDGICSDPECPMAIK